MSKLNCEVLHDDLAFEVRWAVAGDSIVLQLVAKLDNREYMSFGISGDERSSVMVGGDVVVAWVDKETLKGYAEDYYLDAKAQCSGPKGSCPDSKLADNTNNIRLLNAAMVNGYSIVTYQRPLRPADQYDRQILTNQTQPIIWAIGPLNQRNEVSFHSQYNKRDRLIDFGRPAKWNCPMPEGDQPTMKVTTPKSIITEAPVDEIIEEDTPKPTRSRNNERRRGGSSRQPVQTTEAARDSEKSASRTRASERRGSNRATPRPVPTPAPVSNRNAWDIPPIQCYEPEDGVFYAQMGPTGGKRGYPAITGHVGWGISWYINGLLIPVINVVRGKQYTFVVEGGFDPEIPAKYHPFYITDDSVGGYEYKTPEEKKNVRIFAGAKQSKDGTVSPTGVGRLCHWTHQGDSDADDFDSFGAYQRTLELKCDQGEPGVIQWTPDKDTPDTVYYQCFTHRYLGWKINVLDSCDEQASGSEIDEVVAAPDIEDLSDSPSIRVETRIKPNNIEELEKEAKDSLSKIDDLSLFEAESFPIIKEDNTQETVLLQELPKIENELTFRTIDELQKEIKNITYAPKPFPGKIVLRRPISMHNRPPFIMKPYMKPPGMHRHSSPMMLKKPYYRPMIKIPLPMRPMIHHPPKFEKPFINHRPQNVIIMKPHMRTKLNPEPIKHEPRVEISPPQHSTEREPNQQTEKATVVLPENEKRYETYESMKPARNTGFNPASVVIESGFKPILSKDAERRSADSDESPEIEFESETGVIDETKSDQKATEFFEPIFIPSPTIDNQMKKNQFKRSKPKKAPVMFVLKQGRSIDDDEMVAANERVESYYLPPDTNKAKPVERPMQRSNIDVPPGTVVTYDGKKLSGASLTVRAGDQRSVLESRSSKASEYIRARPQFVPFKGELPPLDQQFVNLNAPQLRSLNRQLDTPQLQGSTKLQPVRQLKERNERRKRSAHHNEEHTAEQERKRQKQEKDGVKSSSNIVQISLYTILPSLLTHYLIKLY